MTTLREQEILALMNSKGGDKSVEAVCDLLKALGYEDVAAELLRRWDEITGWH